MFAEANQKQNFQDRLKRVKAGGANTMSQMYCGTIESAAEAKASKGKKPKFRAEKGPKSNVSLPVSLISGLLIGASAVILTRYLRFKLNGGNIVGTDADLLMVADIILAITIAIILRAVFRFNSKTHGFGKLAGVTATVLLMHNVVHVAPAPFERMYSANWVNQVVEYTTAKSVLVAGVSYEFSDAKMLSAKLSPVVQ